MSSKFVRLAVLSLMIAVGFLLGMSRASIVQADTLNYPWYDATTLNQATYDWGYATCPSSDSGCKNYSNLLYTINGVTYGEADPWGYSLRNCTSYTAWRLTSVGVPSNSVTGLGNGGQWYNTAPAAESIFYFLQTVFRHL